MKKPKPGSGLLRRLIQKFNRTFNPSYPLINYTASRRRCDDPCKPSTDFQASLTRLEAEVQIIKEQLLRLQSALEAQKSGIENYTVERMYVDKFELTVESIDVETVSGALNVGIIHNSVVDTGKTGGMSSPGAGHKVTASNLKQIINEHLDTGQKSPMPASRDREEKKYTRTFYPNQVKPKIIIGKID